MTERESLRDARPRGIGGTRVRLTDWRRPAYRGADLQPQIRWAAGSPTHLVIESPRRRYRLTLRIGWWRA